jgi:hypothetical protein
MYTPPYAARDEVLRLYRSGSLTIGNGTRVDVSRRKSASGLTYHRYPATIAAVHISQSDWCNPPGNRAAVRSGSNARPWTTRLVRKTIRAGSPDWNSFTHAMLYFSSHHPAEHQARVVSSVRALEPAYPPSRAPSSGRRAFVRWDGERVRIIAYPATPHTAFADRLICAPVPRNLPCTAARPILAILDRTDPRFRGLLVRGMNSRARE